MPGQVAAVVVDHDAGPLLFDVRAVPPEEGAAPVVVVENGSPGSVARALAALLADDPGAPGRRRAGRGRTWATAPG